MVEYTELEPYKNVALLLFVHKFPQYIRALLQQHIDWDLLKTISKTDLFSCGISVGCALTLLKAATTPLPATTEEFETLWFANCSEFLSYLHLPTLAYIVGNTGVQIGELFASLGSSIIVRASEPDGVPRLVKVLTGPRSAVDAEIAICTKLNKHCSTYSFVSYRPVKVVLPASEVHKYRRHGHFRTLLMNNYILSLDKLPAQSPKTLFMRSLDVVHAVIFMHALGYVHMDINGQNVMIDHDGRWYLGDFGSTVTVNSPVRSSTFVWCPVGKPALFKYDYYMAVVMLIAKLDKGYIADLKVCGVGSGLYNVRGEYIC
jgi:hypothetical protein